MKKGKKRKDKSLCIAVQGLTGVYLFRMHNPKGKMGLMNIRIDKRPLKEGLFYKQMI